jgi:hypothetical protein
VAALSAGRVPPRVDRALVRAIAARDLESADAYVAVLCNAAFPAGVIAACRITVADARAELGARRNDP